MTEGCGNQRLFMNSLYSNWLDAENIEHILSHYIVDKLKSVICLWYRLLKRLF